MARNTIRYTDMRGGNDFGGSPKGENRVVYGRFPKKIKASKVSFTDRLNAFLSVVLLGLVILSLVSYYFVSDSERTMNNLRREIIDLNNENIELQNKLDTMHSFNKVDAIIHGKTTLDTAKKVIEVPAADKEETVTKKNFVPVNYNWSIGY